VKALGAAIAQLVTRIAPQLLPEPAFGPLTAAKLVGEIAGASHFATEANPMQRLPGTPPRPRAVHR
jgi:hypothetical protein